MTSAPETRTDWVLDLRDTHINSPDGLRLTNPTAHGTIAGYSVSAQRRNGLCIVLTAPDGRTVNLVSFLDASASNAKSPVSSALSPAVGYAFRENPTPAQVEEAAARIEAVIVAAHHCLSHNINGTPARVVVQSAALGLDPIEVQWWREKLSEYPGDYRNAPQPREVGWLLAAGFTVETTREWFRDSGTVTRVPNKGSVALRAAFRDHGWTWAQVVDLSFECGREVLTAAWAKVGPNHAGLAFSAGLSAREALHLLARSEWDEDTLRMMAGLLGNTAPAPAVPA